MSFKGNMLKAFIAVIVFVEEEDPVIVLDEDLGDVTWHGFLVYLSIEM